MRILFITANRLGDAVLSTGLLGHLAEQYPSAKFTVVAGPLSSPIFEAAPGLEHIIRMEKKPYAKHWLSLWQQTIFVRWDLVIDLRRSIIGWLLSAKERRTMPAPDPSCHRVRLISRIVGLEDCPPAPRLWHTENQIKHAQNIIPEDQRVIAIAPAANWLGKQWRAANFADLMKNLTVTGGLFPDALVAVIAAKSERNQAVPLLDAIPPGRRIDLVGTVDLGTLGACLSRCSFFVGNDSGLMHMAAATGIPTLGLFGPSKETLYAPWGGRTHWVRTPESFETLTGALDYDHRTTGTLMDGLTVDMVEDAARQFWQGIKNGTA